MTGPAPTDAELQQILGAAQRAADHRPLRPWRFIVVRPEHYQEFFDRLAAAATRVQGDPTRYQINRDKYELTQRAPLLVVAAAKIELNHKIAPIEQAFAAAGATQLVLNAAHALDYKAFLFSGAGVFDEEFKASLGLGKQDHLIGFICIGKAAGSEQGDLRARRIGARRTRQNRQRVAAVSRRNLPPIASVLSIESIDG